MFLKHVLEELIEYVSMELKNMRSHIVELKLFGVEFKFIIC